MRARQSVLLTALLFVFPVGCAKCRPDLVGAGVARLTVRNVGTIVDQLNANTQCGFESPEVKSGFTTQGQVGNSGSATWTVTECELDFGKSSQIVDTDCEGNATSIGGKVIVSATRTIAGTLTGNQDQPVVPLSPDAVTIEVTRAELHNFIVEASNSDAKLTQISGSVSAVVKPKLAASASTGVCMIPTTNVAVTDIKYENAQVRVVTADHDITAEIQSSDYWAINGRFGQEENSISGTITIWGSVEEVPGDEDGLDPEYDRDAFDKGYACKDDLKQPVSFECGDVGPLLAQGAARLTIRTLGAIASVTEHDANCGFSAQAVLQNARLSGPSGSNGDATFRIDNCAITVPDNTVIKTDCNGLKTIAGGLFTVTATKKLSGRLSGDVSEPVVPNTDTPAVLDFESIQFDNFRVEENGTALTIVGGTLAGQLVPRVAFDTVRGACAAETSMARFSGVAYAPDSKLKLSAEQGTFETTVDGSNLAAVAGTMGSDTNMLDGTISLGGKQYSLPTDPQDDGLDPEFNASTYDASWKCGNVSPDKPFECSIAQTLGTGAAQLSVLTLGTIADYFDKDTTCGFASPGVLTNVVTNGTLGDPGGTATFSVTEPCSYTFTTPTAEKTDCNGKTIFMEGTVSVRGTKVLNGYVSGDPVQPIVPTSRDPALVNLEITFSEFRVSSNADANALTAHSGTLSGTIHPRTAIDLVTGACSIETPLARMENISWNSGSLKVESEGKSFDVTVSASNLSAVNGSLDAETNRLRGSITTDGDTVMLDGALDPMYSQSAFDASFSCTPNMAIAPDDSACNMKKVLAEGTARLLIAGLGAITGVVNDDSDCGFSANLTHPSSVVGDPGQMGSMEWEISNCELTRNGRDATREYATDCLDRKSYWSGAATISGKRHVDGLRKEISLIIVRFQSITPTSRESVTVTESMINFNEFKSYDLNPMETVPSRSVTIHSGSMTAEVKPILGERANAAGTFDVPTAVARLSNVSVTNAQVTIVSDGKTFNVLVDSAMLSAFNGSYASSGEKNFIGGTITVGGQSFTLDPKGLDPEFNQADFDARYACTDNLASTIPSAP